MVSLKLKCDVSLTKVKTYIDDSGSLAVNQETVNFEKGEIINNVNDIVPRDDEEELLSNIKLEDGSVIINVPESCFDASVTINMSDKNIPDNFKRHRPCGGCGG